MRWSDLEKEAASDRKQYVFAKHFSRWVKCANHSGETINQWEFTYQLDTQKDYIMCLSRVPEKPR